MLRLLKWASPEDALAWLGEAGRPLRPVAPTEVNKIGGKAMGVLKAAIDDAGINSEVFQSIRDGRWDEIGDWERTAILDILNQNIKEIALAGSVGDSANLRLDAKGIESAVVEPELIEPGHYSASHDAKSDRPFRSTRYMSLVTNDMSGGLFAGARFRGMNLRRLIFIGADLRKADLASTDLTQTNFTGANLSGANLAHSTLDQTVLADVDLSTVNLEGIVHKGASLLDYRTIKRSGSLPASFLSGTGTSQLSGFLEGTPHRSIKSVLIAGREVDKDRIESLRKNIEYTSRSILKNPWETDVFIFSEFFNTSSYAEFLEFDCLIVFASHDDQMMTKSYLEFARQLTVDDKLKLVLVFPSEVELWSREIGSSSALRRVLALPQHDKPNYYPAIHQILGELEYLANSKQGRS